jgi:hypothetical protein
MCNNQEKIFFFYNRFTSQLYLDKISVDYNVKDGYIFVYDYNLKINYVIINKNENENKKKLKGKIVFFNSLKIPQILKRINNMFSSNNYDSNYSIYCSDVLKILKKYNWFEKVLDFIPLNVLYIRSKYKVIKSKYYIENNQYNNCANVII